MSAATAVQPAERQDIHKSCRTIEALLSVLNDYCEAASAFAAIQKKLSKALKDAAGLKMNLQFAASAFGASAGILEILADVDSKFAKIAERERSNVNSEVKKWFKKLAKEEKAHDQRLEESNARIKQAGQAYEKKSKKGARDTSEEHARYINLLSVLGPEMSQEKFNHAVHVTQQHTSVTFHVAAGLSRIADAEWVRTCESMRRISPTVGQLGEWRALCEGSWTGPLPDDLPDFSREGVPTQGPGVSEWGQTGLSTPLRRSLPVPPVGNNSPGSVSASATTTLDPPRSPFSMDFQNQGSINSISTLSAFPFPPTYFPIPLASNEAELQRQQAQFQNIQLVQSRAGSPNLARSQATLVPLAHVLTDSPKAMGGTALGEPFVLDTSKSLHSSQVIRTPPKVQQPRTDTRAQDEAGPEATAIPLESKEGGVSGGDPHKPRRPSFIGLGSQTSRPGSPFKRAEQASSEKEFGIQSDASSRSVFKSHSVDSAKKNLERTDSTNSAGNNNVAALRSKYTRTVETPSQGPKDIPRLPMSVSEIISRYQPLDEPLSPRRTASPTVDRFPLPVETPARQSARDVPIEDNEIRRRKQRIEELAAELELKEKEYELRQREHELDQRARDFERDKQHFLHFRPEPSNASDGPKGPRNSPFRHKRGSQSVSNLNPTSSTSSSSIAQPRPSPSRSPSRSPLLLPPKDHAPFCGCDTCSVSKYKAIDVSPAPRDLRPPVPPIVLRPERPKGWIRRLSMPSVNVAFSLDAKKNASVVSLKSGLPLPAENGRFRKRSFEQGISNRTLAGIGR